MLIAAERAEGIEPNDAVTTTMCLFVSAQGLSVSFPTVALVADILWLLRIGWVDQLLDGLLG